MTPTPPNPSPPDPPERDKPTEGAPKPPRTWNVGYLLMAILGVVILQDLIGPVGVEQLRYSEFQELLEQRAVKELVVSNNEIRGELKETHDGKTRFITTRVDPALLETLEESGVDYSGHVDSMLGPILLSWLFPVLLFVGLYFFVFRRMAGKGGPTGGFMSVGRSKAKVYVETDTKVDFSHVAGVDEAKEELRETVNFLKNPKQYGRLGARMPKGVLLVGPPGTGKTLLARAVAGEAAVPFFSISGSEFVEMFVGVGAARVRDLFEQARQKAPCIIFIDELDALGRARSGQGPMGGHDEKEQTLNQLLVELDGFDPSEGVVILAATNRPEILDPALLRAGRFDRQVLVDRPDRNGRTAILLVHLAKVIVGPDLDPEKVAALTPGFTGADLANLANEAALVATRRDGDSVSMEDVTQAIERIVAGLEKKNRILNEKERGIVAHHEMGHALVAAGLPGTDPVHKVSIIPRGIGALGYTLQRPTDDRYVITRLELEYKMAVLLGGRAAEHVIFNHLSTGAADDLGRATDIARSMATRYAMVDELGHATWDEDRGNYLGVPALPGLSQRPYGDETARAIDGAVRRLVDEAFERARALLIEHREVLERSARALLEGETLDESGLEPFFVCVRPQEVAEEAPAAAVPVGEDGDGETV